MSPINKGFYLRSEIFLRTRVIWNLSLRIVYLLTVNHHPNRTSISSSPVPGYWTWQSFSADSSRCKPSFITSGSCTPAMRKWRGIWKKRPSVTTMRYFL